jgi:hypothetical protein
MARHEHSPVPDGQGREICRFCHQVLVKPILSSDDPRLVDAGLNRSGSDDDELGYAPLPPLPDLLIALYHEGPSFGLAKAPAAHYVHLAAQEEGRRYENDIATLVGGLEDMWTTLARRL